MEPFDQTDLELISKYLGGNATAAEIEQVLAWEASDPARAQMLKEWRKLWQQSAEAALYGQIDMEGEWAKMKGRMTPVPGKVVPVRRNAGWWKWAAAILLVGGTAWWALTSQRKVMPPVAYNQVTLSKGQRMQLVLTDGTKVWLNGNTVLRYPSAFGPDRREVEITGGAYFEVAENADAPFIVKTPDYAVRVLGTEFRVMAYPGNPVSVTTLVKGAVQIEGYDSAGRVQVLKAGHEAVFDRENKTMSVHASDLTRNMQMKGVVLSFKGITMKDLAKKLEATYGINIKLADDSLRNLKFTGKFYDDETVWKALDVISLTAPVKYTFTGNEIYIYWQ
ncbi:FecR domain-containing protein [Chitinophaga sp.]|uniref:FecR domain-containing protein n=1 Tax=Chitinophaga sp. TaxID=1869181 RepID=UPI0031D5EF4C